MISYLKEKKQRLFIIVLLISLAAGIFALVWQWFNNDDRSTLLLYGNVDIRQVDLSFRVGGRIKKVLVDEGDTIKPGETLAILDKAPYMAALAAAKAQVAAAEANFTKLKTGSRPQEIEEARALVRVNQATYDNALLIYNREKKQLVTGATSQQVYDTALAQKLEAESLLKKTKETLSLAIEGYRIEDIHAGQATMEVAIAQLNSAEINLKDTEIHAPNAGTIYTRVREPGAVVGPGNPVLTLSLFNPIWVRAYISEPELGLIKPGMEALVYTDSYPDKPYKGQIGFISPRAEFTPKTVETPELRTDLVYRLRIVMEDPKRELRQGMPVTVKIKISQ